MVREKHPLAGKLVKATIRNVKNGQPVTIVCEYRIEDWWENVSGQSWRDSNGNVAACLYGMRCGFNGLPPDDEVVYGKVGALGHLVHVSELGEVVL